MLEETHFYWMLWRNLCWLFHIFLRVKWLQSPFTNTWDSFCCCVRFMAVILLMSSSNGRSRNHHSRLDRGILLKQLFCGVCFLRWGCPALWFFCFLELGLEKARNILVFVWGLYYRLNYFMFHAHNFFFVVCLLFLCSRQNLRWTKKLYFLRVLWLLRILLLWKWL